MSTRPFEIIYDPEQGDAIADAKIMPRALALAARLKAISTQGQECIASETYIMAVRLLIARGQIAPQAVVFKFQGEVVPIYTDPASPNLGKFINYPDGFCDYWDNLVTDLLDQADAIRKQQPE